MPRRFDERLQHILEAIVQIEGLADGQTSTSIETNPICRAAFERFVEIINEASRHIPDVAKARQPQIPWRRIADIGNHLRHGYETVEFEILWKLVTQRELEALKAAIVEMKDAAKEG
ncbi:DUF86 domain-containing protein [Mesorhizobium sp. IMUNJ 23232]|uniref:DUF86 domain-containing protein n=1 Tax=Mesorhizobium sp. IMUNJ 23232 TaxID=3376064 RepID=UPI0037A1A7EB